MDKDDHNDLVTILLSQTSENIPEDMKCMWEQQITLIQQNKSMVIAGILSKLNMHISINFNVEKDLSKFIRVSGGGHVPRNDA